MLSTFFQQIRQLFQSSKPKTDWSCRFRLDDTFGHFWMADQQGQWYPMRFQSDVPTYTISYDGVHFQPFDVDTHLLFSEWFDSTIAHQSSLHRFFSARRAFLAFILTCINTQEKPSQKDVFLFPYQSRSFVDDYSVSTSTSVTTGTVHRYVLTVDQPTCYAEIHATLSLFLLVDTCQFNHWHTALQLQQRIDLLNQFIRRTHLPLDVLTHHLLDEQHFLLHPHSDEMFSKYETLHIMGMPVDPLTLVRTYNQTPMNEGTVFF